MNLLSPLKRALLFGARYLFSASLFFFSLTLGIFIRKGREFLLITCRYFQAGSITGVPREILKTVRFSDICENTCVRIIEPVYKDGNVSLLELATINVLVEKYNNEIVFRSTYSSHHLYLTYPAALQKKIDKLDVNQTYTITFAVNNVEMTMMGLMFNGELLEIH